MVAKPKDIPHLVWNLKVHDHIHKSLSLVPILSQMNHMRLITNTVGHLLVTLLGNNGHHEIDLIKSGLCTKNLP